MKRLIIPLLAAITILIPVSSVIAIEGKPAADGYKEVEVQGIVLKWKIEENTIHVILSAPTEGWVAVGFAPTRMMKDANIIIGYVKNGNPVIGDHYGSGNTRHEQDTSLGGTENVTVTGGSEAGGVTTLMFSMPLASGDSYDKVLKEGSEYRVIFAYGSKDDMTSYHRKRAGIDLTL